MDTKESKTNELIKKNEILQLTLKKREEQLETNSRLVSEYNEKNQEVNILIS